MEIRLYLNSTSEMARFLATHGKEKPAKVVDPHELAMGIKVEREHADDQKIAEVIARQHLSENPHYYSQGKKAGLFPELGKSVRFFLKSQGFVRKWYQDELRSRQRSPHGPMKIYKKPSKDKKVGRSEFLNPEELPGDMNLLPRKKFKLPSDKHFIRHRSKWDRIIVQNSPWRGSGTTNSWG